MYHALSCKKHGGLILRHDMMKDVLVELCHSARLSWEVEPQQALNGCKQRPDLLIRFAWNGYDAAYDLTIHNPVRDKQAIKSTIKNDQKFLKTVDQVKRDKYQEKCAENGTLFFSIVFSAFGGILEESYHDTIEPLMNKVKTNNFVPPNWAAHTKTEYWLQRLAIALWAGNVRKVSPFLKKEPILSF